MTTPSTSTRYSAVAIVLHWSIAIFILFNLAVGWFMNDMPPSVKMMILPLHVSGGMTVLVLSVIRVLWRLTHKPPPLFSDMPAIERLGAHVVHILLYVAMIAMPIIGWLLLSAHPARPGPGFPIWWGLTHLKPVASIEAIATQPNGVAVQDAWHTTFVEMHTIGGWVMIMLLILHIAGALKHQFVDRHAEFARMGIGSAKADA